MMSGEKMTKDLKQRTFYIYSVSYDQFCNHAERAGLPISEFAGKAIDYLIEKYDPNDPEKLKQWVEVPLDLERQTLRSIYLELNYVKMVQDFADKASIAVGEKVARGAVIRSAIMEYLKEGA